MLVLGEGGQGKDNVKLKELSSFLSLCQAGGVSESSSLFDHKLWPSSEVKLRAPVGKKLMFPSNF